MENDQLLLRMVTLAEEIKSGKGTPEKSIALAEIVLKMNDHLFNGGTLPSAWFIPMITDFAPGMSDPEESGIFMIEDDINFDVLSDEDLGEKKTLRRLSPIAV